MKMFELNINTVFYNNFLFSAIVKGRNFNQYTSWSPSLRSENNIKLWKKWDLYVIDTWSAWQRNLQLAGLNTGFSNDKSTNPKIWT